MHESTAAPPQVIFGFGASFTATAIFLLVYVLVISEKVNRAITALLGATLLILSGVLTQEAAIRGIDFNTIGLLLGMMVIVNITGKSGVFEFVAIWSAKRVRAHPAGVLLMLSLVTATLSAILDNVTTVLLVVPVTLLLTEELQVRPYPFLVSEILFSNIGGTATLIGDPPNIMIGSRAGLPFLAFLTHLGPVVAVIGAATLAPLFWMWRRELTANAEARRRVMEFQESEAIKDRRLLRQSLAVIAAVLAGFLAAHSFHVQPATIALSGAALLLLADNFGRPSEDQSQRVHRAFADVEWVTLLFFLGLFILVQGLESTGVIGAVARQLLAATEGDPRATAVAILWGSALLSAFVDNIPFVATMIPLIQAIAPALGGAHALLPLWWALSLGACLGGNGTLIGASANLVVAGLSERAGHPIRFLAYFRTCFLLMLLSIGIAHLYLVLRYF